jgi:hypothetical protein
MTANDILQKINLGINAEFIASGNTLDEPNEKMCVPLSKYEKNFVLIKPKDDERKYFWSFFSDKVYRKTADYILYEIVNEEVVCFILELKKTKTGSNTDKATKQIKSTFPLAKMIYEKTTGQNPKYLKTIGIRVFGPIAGKKNSKITKNDRRKIPNSFSNDNLAIGYFTQNSKNTQLTSLANFFKKTNEQLSFSNN